MDTKQLLADFQNDLRSVFDTIDIAEEEISAAQHRHPSATDRIWRSFRLLRPPADDLTRNDLAYRAHCRELLDRVAAGADTRPGTAAECCVALCQVSQRVPLTTSAAGLYARMWKLADLPPIELTDASTHYEALEGTLIDDQEAMLRKKLSQDWRQLTPAGPAGPDR